VKSDRYYLELYYIALLLRIIREHSNGEYRCIDCETTEATEGYRRISKELPS